MKNKFFKFLRKDIVYHPDTPKERVIEIKYEISEDLIRAKVGIPVQIANLLSGEIDRFIREKDMPFMEIRCNTNKNYRPVTIHFSLGDSVSPKKIVEELRRRLTDTAQALQRSQEENLRLRVELEQSRKVLGEFYEKVENAKREADKDQRHLGEDLERVSMVEFTGTTGVSEESFE